MPLNAVPDVDDDAAEPKVAAPTSRSGRTSTVTPYDFRRPTKLSRENVRMLQIAFDTFSRRMTTLLTGGLRAVCQVTPGEIIQQIYEEYVTSLPTSTLMAMMTVPPLSGTAVLEFSLPTALAAIDHMLGGPGGQQPIRTLTDVEMTLVRGLLDQFIGTLRYSFEQIVPIQPVLGTIEYNPQFAQAASATDAVVVATFEMTIGSESCTATLCLPLASLLPRLQAHRPKGADAEVGPLGHESAARRLRERLGDVPLEVTVQFTPVSMSTGQILNLAAGDLIPLHHRVGVPLTVDAGGITFANAIAGKAGSRLAALIVDTPQELK